MSEATSLRKLGAQAGLDLSLFLFTLEPGDPTATVYGRMFASHFGITEDPATGSACGPLGAYLSVGLNAARDEVIGLTPTP